MLTNDQYQALLARIDVQLRRGQVTPYEAQMLRLSAIQRLREAEEMLERDPGYPERMTAAAARLVGQRIEQGLPPRIVDSLALREVAAVLNAAENDTTPPS